MGRRSGICFGTPGEDRLFARGQVTYEAGSKRWKCGYCGKVATAWSAGATLAHIKGHGLAKAECLAGAKKISAHDKLAEDRRRMSGMKMTARELEENLRRNSWETDLMREAGIGENTEIEGAERNQKEAGAKMESVGRKKL